MALTVVQQQILKCISKNRSPDSHVGGGAALNANSARISLDIDVFHDAEAHITAAANTDIASLRAARFAVEPTRAERTFVEVVVSNKKGDTSRIQWAVDSAFRFFPAIEDPVFGYRLHDLDLAVNKVLAMAGRREPRDYADVIRLHQDGTPLAALAWAAPAKDPGFTPELLLDEINRNSMYPESRLRSETGQDPRVLKKILLTATREARDLFGTLPLTQAGHLYLDRRSHAALPDPQAVKDGRLTLHAPVLRGAWPVFATVDIDAPLATPQPNSTAAPRAPSNPSARARKPSR